MEKLESLLQKVILTFLLLGLIMELVPVSSNQTAELRLYENTDFRGDNLTYYALPENGHLTAWVQAVFGGMPPCQPKAPAVFGSQGPRRPLAGGAACLGLDGQRAVV